MFDEEWRPRKRHHKVVGHQRINLLPSRFNYFELSHIQNIFQHQGWDKSCYLCNQIDQSWLQTAGKLAWDRLLTHLNQKKVCLNTGIQRLILLCFNLPWRWLLKVLHCWNCYQSYSWKGRSTKVLGSRKGRHSLHQICLCSYCRQRSLLNFEWKLMDRVSCFH